MTDCVPQEEDSEWRLLCRNFIGKEADLGRGNIGLWQGHSKDPTGIHVGSYEVGMALQSCPTLRRGKWGFEALYSDIVIMIYLWV